MDNISFQSRIRIVPISEYALKIRGCRTNVPYPWTVKQTVCAPKARTEKVFDCTALGVTDGSNVLLMHICPTAPENSEWNKLEKFLVNSIKSKLDVGNLQGLILGGKKNNINSPKSIALFEFFESIFNKLNIPYSKFKGGFYENNLAYNSREDEWIIGNDLLDCVSKDVFGSTPEKVAKKIFEDVKIAECDELTW